MEGVVVGLTLSCLRDRDGESSLEITDVGAAVTSEKENEFQGSPWS